MRESMNAFPRYSWSKYWILQYTCLWYAHIFVLNSMAMHEIGFTRKLMIQYIFKFRIYCCRMKRNMLSINETKLTHVWLRQVKIMIKHMFSASILTRLPLYFVASFWTNIRLATAMHNAFYTHNVYMFCIEHCTFIHRNDHRPCKSETNFPVCILVL